MRNWRSHKVSALWCRCVKSKMWLFLGTFKEMSPWLLKWCTQNHRLCHASWAKKKPEWTHLHSYRVSYLQLTCAGKNKIKGFFVVIYGKQSLPKTPRSSLLMIKQAWLTQTSSWESKHYFFLNHNWIILKLNANLNSGGHEGTCLRPSAQSTVEQISEIRTGMPRRKVAPCFSILKKKKKKREGVKKRRLREEDKQLRMKLGLMKTGY